MQALEKRESQKTVLVVDDDPDILELMVYNLKAYGYKVETSTSGLQALWKLGSNDLPDCIILDIKMPSPNGFELCHFLKSTEHYRHIPILIISACSSPEDIERGLSLGAEAYLPKGMMSMASLLEFVGHYANLVTV